MYSLTCHLMTACQHVLAATEENHLTYDSAANGLPTLEMCRSHIQTRLYCQCTNFLLQTPDITITTATLKQHRRKLTFYYNCDMATPNLQANVLNCVNFKLCIHNVLGDKTVHL